MIFIWTILKPFRPPNVKACKHVRSDSFSVLSWMHGLKCMKMERAQTSHQSKDIAWSRWAVLQAHMKYLIITISELQPTSESREIGAITQPLSQASHTMCFWKQKVTSFCCYLKVYLKMQLMCFFYVRDCWNSLSTTTKDHNLTRMKK